MRPRAFHELATRLASSEDPADLRTAISRAYYAVYHVAREMLESASFRISKGPAGHAEVFRCLSNCGIPELQRMSSDLGDLRSRRNDADYDLKNEYVELPSTARYYAKTSENIIRALEACQNEPQRSKLISGVKLYLSKIGPGSR